MRKPRIYISSAYYHPSKEANIRRVAEEFNWIMFELNDEAMPLSILLMAHTMELLHPRTPEDWIKISLDWLQMCDVMYVLEGESSLQDREIAAAKAMNIPIVYNKVELREYLCRVNQETLTVDYAKRQVALSLHNVKADGKKAAKQGLNGAKRILGKAASRTAATVFKGVKEVASSPDQTPKEKKF